MSILSARTNASSFRNSVQFEPTTGTQELPAAFHLRRISNSGATMNRNLLYLLVGALIVGVGVLGYSLYQEHQKPGLSISIGGKEGLRIEGK